MTRQPSLSPWSIVATILAFGPVVAGNVPTNGLRHPSPARLSAACAVIAIAIGYMVWRIRQFRALDEMHQRASSSKPSASRLLAASSTS